MVKNRMILRRGPATALLSVSLIVVCSSALDADGGRYRTSPHGSPQTGVYRSNDYPRGTCAQCHSSHDAVAAYPFALFRENSSDLCMTASQGGCHADQPTGATSGYPAQEADRMPIGSSDPGYFEYNSGGIRLPGLANLVRWPGQQVWEDVSYSSHRSDPDMPIKDVFGYGSCDNCHNVHGGPSSHDMLDTTYGGITKSSLEPLAANLELCLSCHSRNGPVGMSDSAKYIADYYDRSLNPSGSSGHGVLRGSGYVTASSRLPCYDCHNPHGSQGYGKLGANGFLLSDQRPGWYGLTDIKNDSIQVRRFCFGCHKASDGAGGGIVEGLTLPALPNTVTAHASSATAHCYNCHAGDYTSPSSHNVHNPDSGGDCISCHSTARGQRRAVVGEFAGKAHHGVKQGAGGSITKQDCGVCHMEGSASTGEISGQYHRNGQVDLRDPDTGGPITGFASFSRNLNSSFLEPWVVDVQDQLCLKCHDNDGAMSPEAVVPGGSALKPFSGQDAVVDVFTQFSPLNVAYHPVRAAGQNQYCVPSDVNGNRTTMLPPFNQTATHDVVSCFDCHEANGHGGGNSGLLYTETYFREPVPNANFGAAQQTFCGRCHDPNTYLSASEGSRFGLHDKDDHARPTAGDDNWRGCRGCHSGDYDEDGMTTCNNGSGTGNIHGSSFAYSSCSPTPSVSPKAFLFGGYLKGWTTQSSTSYCYANCHHPSGVNY